MAKFFSLTFLMLVAQASVAYSELEHCVCPNNCNTEDETMVKKMSQNMEILIENENLRSQLKVLNTKLLRQEELLKGINNFCGNDLPDNCLDATVETNKSGIYKIELKNFNRSPFYVSCNAEVQAGGWLVILRRQSIAIDFNKNWEEYRHGFGNLKTDFFIGLDKLHDLTKNAVQELLIVMEDYDGERRYAKYDSFAIESEADGYAMSVLGKYTGDAGDSMTHHQGFMFTTKDRHHDNTSDNCAVQYSGGWWYNACYLSHLTGTYLNDELSKKYHGKGVTWHTFHGYDKGLKFVEMMIRPRKA